MCLSIYLSLSLSLIRLIRKLHHFFKPESDQFSKLDLSDVSRRQMVISACYLVDFLLASQSEEADRLTTDWLTDVAENIKEVYFVLSCYRSGRSLLKPPKILLKNK